MISKESFNSCVGFSLIKNLGGEYLDKNNILWRISENGMIGKRSVYTENLRACWIDDLRGEKIMSYWCGENSDYQEVFEFRP
jgi:hypothetical protein